MQIDWFTFVAQIVNFLILVVLLRLFLYKPILNAMRDREERIRQRMEQAEEREREAEEVKQEFEDKRDDLRHRESEILEEAKSEAQSRRDELLKEARQEAEEAEKRWREAVRRDKDAFLSGLRRRAAQELCAVARRALADLADAELERQVVHVFAAKLRDLPDDAATALADATKDGQPVRVRTAFELTGDAEDEVRQALDAAGHSGDMTVERDEDLVCGLELRFAGHRIAWSVDGYLGSLERRFSEAVERSVRSDDDGDSDGDGKGADE
ncbi:MAG: F0F1 ATP synthase subunit B [Armatimonadia bacterium]|nr:F0F1 ATP synthase subunit B [Armatimonadia bacterium]